MLKSDIRRFLTGPAFWLLVAAGFVVYNLDYLTYAVDSLTHGFVLEGLHQYVGSNLMALYIEFTTSMMGWLYPLLCIIPFATSLVDEASNGALRLSIYRTGRRQFVWKRFFTVGLSGGLCCALVMLLSAALLGFMLPMPGKPLPDGWPDPSMDMQIIKSYAFFHVFLADVRASTPGVFFLFAAHQIVCNFIGGFLYAVLALGISTWFRNRFFAVAVPVALYILGNATISFFPGSIWILPSVHNMFLDIQPFYWPRFADKGMLFTSINRAEWLVAAATLYALGARRMLRDV